MQIHWFSRWSEIDLEFFGPRAGAFGVYPGKEDHRQSCGHRNGLGVLEKFMTKDRLEFDAAVQFWTVDLLRLTQNAVRTPRQRVFDFCCVVEVKAFDKSKNVSLYPLL